MEHEADQSAEERQESLDFWNMEWRQNRPPIEEYDPFGQTFEDEPSHCDF